MGGKIVIQNNDGTSKELSNDDIIKLLREQQANINTLVGEIKQRDEIITTLKTQSLRQHNTGDNISLNIIEHDEKRLMTQINHIN
jgi:uncharacterized protein YjcR